LKKAAIILASLAVVAYGGFRVWSILFPGDEAEIREMLGELSTAATFRVSSKPLTQMGKAAELTGFFTESIEIQIKGPEGVIRRIMGRPALQQAAMSAQTMGGGFSIQFKDIIVMLGEQKGVASCRMTAVAKGAGEPTPWVQILEFDVQEHESGWKVNKIRVVEAVERIQ